MCVGGLGPLACGRAQFSPSESNKKSIDFYGTYRLGQAFSTSWHVTRYRAVFVFCPRFADEFLQAHLHVYRGQGSASLLICPAAHHQMMTTDRRASSWPVTGELRDSNQRPFINRFAIPTVNCARVDSGDDHACLSRRSSMGNAPTGPRTHSYPPFASLRSTRQRAPIRQSQKLPSARLAYRAA